MTNPHNIAQVRNYIEAMAAIAILTTESVQNQRESPTSR